MKGYRGVYVDILNLYKRVWSEWKHLLKNFCSVHYTQKANRLSCFFVCVVKMGKKTYTHTCLAAFMHHPVCVCVCVCVCERERERGRDGKWVSTWNSASCQAHRVASGQETDSRWTISTQKMIHWLSTKMFYFSHRKETNDQHHLETPQRYTIT